MWVYAIDEYWFYNMKDIIEQTNLIVHAASAFEIEKI